MIRPLMNSGFAAVLAVAAVLGTLLLCFAWTGEAPPAVFVPVVACVALLTLGRCWVEIPLYRRPWLRHAVAAVWALLLACLLLGPNLRAEWSIIDDHEIVHTFDGNGRLTARGLATLLATHRELGGLAADWPRYRPSYYFLRFVECSLWGDHPTVWYLSRLGLFALTLFLFWQILWRYWGGVGACLLLLATLTYDFWTDIFSRLGPAETYAVAGVALYFWAFVRLLTAVARCRHQDLGGVWAALTFGALVAMGSKENFLLLLPSTWLLAIWLWRRGKLHASGWLATGVVTAAFAFIAAVVAHRLGRSAVDVYQASVAPGDRLSLWRPGAWLLWERWEGKVLTVGGILLAVLCGVAFARQSAPRRSLGRVVFAIVTAFAVTEVLLISQYIFYNGDWPNESRYDFPGLLVFPALATFEVWVMRRLLRSLGVAVSVRRALFGCALGAFAGIVLARGISLPGAMHDNVATTRWFKQALDRIVLRLKAEPDRAVLLVSHSGWDYEPVLSLKRFLAFRQVSNPIFLRLTYGPKKHSHPMAIDQTRQLQELSLQGHSGTMTAPWTFEPLDRLRANPRPFGIGFSGAAGSETEDLGMIWR